MPKLFDRVKVNIATTGTGTVTFGSVSSNAFLTPTEAGCADADTVRYVIVDGTDFEEGIGTIGASVSTMARTTVTKSKIGGTAGTSKINLSGTAVLALVASAADIVNKADVTTVGNALLTATDAAAAQTAAGGTTVGKLLFTAADAAAARGNLAAIGKVVVQTFTSSGTYTPTAGMVYAVIEMVGGGGGGGGATGTAGNSYSGGGGGSGGYARKIASASDIGASKAVVVGAGGAGGAGSNNGSNGGTSGTGPTWGAVGGSGGKYGSFAQAPAGGAGGAGSSGIGDISSSGAPGGSGSYVSSSGPLSIGGNGGSSYFGGGGLGGSSVTTSNGGAASGYGSGGGGAQVHNSTNTATGGAGSNGIVVITEYCV